MTSVDEYYNGGQSLTGIVRRLSLCAAPERKLSALYDARGEVCAETPVRILQKPLDR